MCQVDLFHGIPCRWHQGTAVMDGCPPSLGHYIILRSVSHSGGQKHSPSSHPSSPGNASPDPEGETRAQNLTPRRRSEPDEMMQTPSPRGELGTLATQPIPPAQPTGNDGFCAGGADVGGSPAAPVTRVTLGEGQSARSGCSASASGPLGFPPTPHTVHVGLK